MKILKEYDLSVAGLICPTEMRSFRDGFAWLQRTLYNLNAVEGGRWTTNDVESVLSSETQNWSEAQLKELRLKKLSEEKNKALEVCVKRLKTLNKAYHAVSNHYIVEYMEDRDKALKAALLRLAAV